MRAQLACVLSTSLAFAAGGCAANPLEIEPFREVACVEAASVSLRDAVRAAERGGGVALDAAYREVHEMGCLEGDAGYHDVTLLKETKLVPVSVDAKTAEVQPRRDQGLLRMLMGQYFERVAEGNPKARIPIAA